MSEITCYTIEPIFLTVHIASKFENSGIYIVYFIAASLMIFAHS